MIGHVGLTNVLGTIPDTIALDSGLIILDGVAQDGIGGGVHLPKLEELRCFIVGLEPFLQMVEASKS